MDGVGPIFSMLGLIGAVVIAGALALRAMLPSSVGTRAASHPPSHSTGVRSRSATPQLAGPTGKLALSDPSFAGPLASLAIPVRPAPTWSGAYTVTLTRSEHGWSVAGGESLPSDTPVSTNVSKHGTLTVTLVLPWTEVERHYAWVNVVVRR